MKNSVLKCNFCGNTENVPIFRDNPHLVRCKRCSLVYTKEQMSMQAIEDFYNEEYFVSDNAISKGYEHYFDNRKNIIRTFRRRLDVIERHVASPGRVLDVGCAAGFFLHVAKKRKWDVCGVDISKVCARYAQDNLRINVHNDLFTNVKFSGQPFDLITMWDYLEHSITPREDIGRAYELLRPGGVFVVATPDISSIPARIFRSNWIGIKLEEHFYYFSRKVLSGMLRDSGFDIVKTAYAGKYVSAQILAARLIFYSGFLSRVVGPMLKNMKFSLYCNPFDIMIMICRKK